MHNLYAQLRKHERTWKCWEYYSICLTDLDHQFCGFSKGEMNVIKDRSLAVRNVDRARLFADRSRRRSSHLCYWLGRFQALSQPDHVQDFVSLLEMKSKQCRHYVHPKRSVDIFQTKAINPWKHVISFLLNAGS